MIAVGHGDVRLESADGEATLCGNHEENCQEERQVNVTSVEAECVLRHKRGE